MKFSSLLLLTFISLSSLQAQTLDYSFVTVGCNRVDDPDSTANQPSTANVYQLNRLFSEVASLNPLPDYLFFTGDMVIGYKTDTVRLANQLRGWIAVYKASPLFGTSVQLVAIPGNHETQDKAAGKLSFPAAERTYVREMAAYIRGANGPVATGLVAGTDSLTTDQSKLTYSFDHKGSHFVILNTDPVGRDSRVPTYWIDNDIRTARTNGAKHIFAFGHKPAYPSVLTVTDGLVAYPYQRNVFWNTMENNQCEAMFSAHNHLWEKQQPHTGKTWQIIAGNGGSSLQSGTAHPYFGYTLVNVYTYGTVTAVSYGRDLNATNYSYAADGNPTTLRDKADITFGAVTATQNPLTVENTFGLSVAPNPVTNDASVSFTLQKQALATLKVYNMKGIPLITVLNETVAPGAHHYTINTQTLANGSYLVGLVSDGQQVTRKIVVNH
ncbi:MAG TPA: T9SS type A sorting domain-containing protein [Cytophagaceae bacterium]|nr:T9SS type A sorting domain-containing protein [Cytophagaceae bacterium]